MESSVLIEMYQKATTNEEIQNIVFNQVRVTRFILLNYNYNPTGRLSVNASIRPHSTSRSVITKYLSRSQKFSPNILHIEGALTWLLFAS